jgi:hypothetical protein
MDTASEILNKYESIFESLPEGTGNLRFGQNIVTVSLIAKQYDCEKALELDFKHPTPATEAVHEGKEGDKSFTTLARPFTEGRAIKDAVKNRRKPLCINEFCIAWKHQNIPIVGYIDETWFRGGDVDLVVELKFAKSLRMDSSYHVQAQLYCLGLAEMGFNNLSTQYKIIVFNRSCYDCPEIVVNSCPILYEPRLTSYECEDGAAISHTYPFDKSKIINDFDFALDFWTNKREAIPTKNNAICHVCRHNRVCPNSLSIQSSPN